MNKNEDTTDCELISRYRAGDHKVLQLLVSRYHQIFCQRAYFVTKDSMSAKDIAQDSWITIIEKLPDLKQPDRFKYWALRIVFTKSVDYLKKRNLMVYMPTDLDLTTTDTDTSRSIKEEQQRALLSAIHSLPQSKQHILRLFYMEQYSIRDIGKLLNIPTGTVKSRLFKAREKLKELTKLDKE